jgi:hypothetical protein
MQFDEPVVTDAWPLPDGLPLYESEASNDGQKPGWWARFVAWFDEYFFGEIEI